MSIRRVFDLAYRTTAKSTKQRERCVDEFFRAYSRAVESDEIEIYETELISCIALCLASPKGSKIDGVFEMLRLALRGSHEDFVTFLGQSILSQLLPGLRAKSKLIRDRTANLMILVLTSLDELEGDLCNELGTAFLERIRDKEASVRTRAVTALSALQEENEDILAELCVCLQTDRNAEVRRQVVKHIEITADTLPFVVQRTRDPDRKVREAVFRRLSQDFSSLNMSMAQIDYVFQSGLRDRDESVRTECYTLVRAFLAGHGTEITQALEYFDVLDFSSLEVVIDSWLDNEFSVHNLDQLLDELTPARSIFIRKYFGHCQKYELGQIDVGSFVVHLAEAIDRAANANKCAPSDKRLAFVIQQLLLICDMVDSKALGPSYEKFVYYLTSPFDEQIECALSIISRIEPDQQKIQSLILNLLTTMSSGGGNLLSRQLGLLEIFLRSAKTLFSDDLVERCISEGMNSSSEEIVCKALRCTGHIASLNQDFAIVNLPILFHSLESGSPLIQATSCQILLDLLTVHGIQELDREAYKGWVEGFLKLSLESDQEQVVLSAAEGISRLFLLNKLKDTNTLQLLLSVYYRSENDDSSKLSQCLSFFFPAYSYLTVENMRSMAEAVIPFLEELNDEEDMEKALKSQMMQQLSEWTDIRNLPTPHNENLHASIALKILTIAQRSGQGELLQILAFLKTGQTNERQALEEQADLAIEALDKQSEIAIIRK
ncbi:nuclear condensing complex subunit [Cladochytrium replicatum]|nr:nuclear condensing complex subunit [Cladochytrium replicatum]